MTWSCEHCSFININDNIRCKVCNIKKIIEINCSVCTLINLSNLKYCEACGSELIQPTSVTSDDNDNDNSSNSSQNSQFKNNKNNNKSNHNNKNVNNQKQQKQQLENDNDSDYEERIIFEYVTKNMDVFIQTITSGNDTRYKCKFDGRICGTKTIMCAYISRTHRNSVVNYMKKNESNKNKSDEALAWELAVLDYKTVTKSSKESSEQESQSESESEPQSELELELESDTKDLSESSSSSNSPTSKLRRKSSNSYYSTRSSIKNTRETTNRSKKNDNSIKKQEYNPEAQATYFKKRYSDCGITTSSKSKNKQELTFEDKETRLTKLLSRSDQIVERLSHLIKPLPDKTQTTSQPETKVDIEKNEDREIETNEEPKIETNKEETEIYIDKIQQEIKTEDKKKIDSTTTTTTSTSQYPYLNGCTLRGYQVSGVEWLCTLHESGLNGILADEMGLGKTLQVIAFFCCLLDRYGINGPHLVVLPLSVLSSWRQDISKFCPLIQPYIHLGLKEDREQNFKEWSSSVINSTNDSIINICFTTYDMILKDTYLLAQLGQKRSTSKSNRVQWSYIVVDEAHRLKNSNSKLFSELIELNGKKHLLLTGTPLQNNLKELWSLLNFILPTIFSDFNEFSDWFNKPFDNLDEPTISKKKIRRKTLPGSSSSSLTRDQDLTDEERALIVASLHRVLKPFILRRVKADVAEDLPKKFEKIIFCPLSTLQYVAYQSVLSQVYKTSNKSTKSSTYNNSNDDMNLIIDLKKQITNQQKKPHLGKLVNLNAANVLMQLRKICNHPFLTLESCISIPDDLYYQYLITSSGKLATLSVILDHLIKEGHKVLIFSQMTTMLDILQGFLYTKGYSCYRLDGNTDRFTRDQIVKEFHQSDKLDNKEDDFENNEVKDNYDQSKSFENEIETTSKDQKIESASIVLLSTRAGGVGINLQSADTVILYDSDWNPQADLQAIGRAHRIGQKNDVLVLRLVSINHQLKYESDNMNENNSTNDDPLENFLSVEEKMLLRATNKLEAERTILAHRQFDLSSSNAEEDLKNIMEELNKISKEDNKESNPSSYYSCDEMINVAHGSQLLPQNTPIFQRIYERNLPQSSSSSGRINETYDLNEENNYDRSENITLMDEKDLDDWKNWFFNDDEIDPIISQVTEIVDEHGRSVRRNRTKVSLCEIDIWKNALEKAGLESEIAATTSPQRKSTPKTPKTNNSSNKSSSNSQKKVEKNDINDTNAKNGNIINFLNKNKNKNCTEKSTNNSHDDSNKIASNIKNSDQKIDDDNQDKCQICGLGNYKTKTSSKILMFCDGCNTPFHVHCLGFNEIPKDSWYCDTCCKNLGIRSYIDIQKEINETNFPQKRKRNNNDIDDDDDVDIEEDINQDFTSVKDKVDNSEFEKIDKNKNTVEIEIVDDDDDEIEIEIVPSKKKHRCTLCNHEVSDFNDLQMHWILDCVEWKKRNEQNEVQGDDQMNYVPEHSLLSYFLNNLTNQMETNQNQLENQNQNENEVLLIENGSSSSSTLEGNNLEATIEDNVAKLDFLGPIIVNTDGTLSRIPNWSTLTKDEQLNTLRLIAKRNKIRMEILKQQQEQQEQENEEKNES